MDVVGITHGGSFLVKVEPVAGCSSVCRCRWYNKPSSGAGIQQPAAQFIGSALVIVSPCNGDGLFRYPGSVSTATLSVTGLGISGAVQQLQPAGTEWNGIHFLGLRAFYQLPVIADSAKSGLAKRLRGPLAFKTKRCRVPTGEAGRTARGEIRRRATSSRRKPWLAGVSNIPFEQGFE